MLGFNPQLSELVYGPGPQTVNLNSSPITIKNPSGSDLDGDKYDYHPIGPVLDSVSTSTVGVNIFANADEGASSYRRYNMQGQGTNVTGTADDTSNRLISLGQMRKSIADRPSLGKFSIKGDSSAERHSNGGFCFQDSGTSLQVNDGYWINTVDTLTSLLLKSTLSTDITFDLRVYRTLKAGDDDLWERMPGKLTWTAESTVKSFTGLDGDLDEEYRIDVDVDVNQMHIRPNGDSSNIYTSQLLANTNATISSSNTTQGRFLINRTNGSLKINAESGKSRLAVINAGQAGGADQQHRRAEWWGNTVDNITSFEMSPTGVLTGTATLYRKRKKDTPADVFPWETIETRVIANADFSAGHTFTLPADLTGDKVFAYRLVYEGDDSATVKTIDLRLNGDTANNYSRQFLSSSSASTSAGANDSNQPNFNSIASCTDVNRGEIVIYPNSGFQRPALGRREHDESQIRFQGWWWENTVDEIINMTAISTSSSPINGTLKLQVLK